MYILIGSSYDAAWALGSEMVGPFASSVIVQPIKFGKEFTAAKSGYARYNALKRFLQSEIVGASAAFKAGETLLGYDKEAAKKAAAEEQGRKRREENRMKPPSERKQHHATASAGTSRL